MFKKIAGRVLPPSYQNPSAKVFMQRFKILELLFLGGTIEYFDPRDTTKEIPKTHCRHCLVYFAVGSLLFLSLPLLCLTSPMGFINFNPLPDFRARPWFLQYAILLLYGLHVLANLYLPMEDNDFFMQVPIPSDPFLKWAIPIIFLLGYLGVIFFIAKGTRLFLQNYKELRSERFLDPKYTQTLT